VRSEPRAPEGRAATAEVGGGASAPAPRTSAPASPSAAAPASAASAVATGKASAPRVIQVGATPNRTRGAELAAALRRKGFEAYVVGKRAPYYIRVRPRRSETAEQTALRLMQLGHSTQLVAE
jgi:cell division septation protein DedD